MPVRSIYQWQVLIQDNTAPWLVADWLLRDLMDYAVVGGQFNDHLEDDRQTVENLLIAYVSVVRSTKKISSHRVNGPIPVLAGDMTVASFRETFAKLSVAAVADTLIWNYLADPACDLGYATVVLKRALTAWAELELSNHGIGLGTDIAPEPSPNKVA